MMMYPLPIERCNRSSGEKGPGKSKSSPSMHIQVKLLICIAKLDSRIHKHTPLGGNPVKFY